MTNTKRGFGSLGYDDNSAQHAAILYQLSIASLMEELWKLGTEDRVPSQLYHGCFGNWLWSADSVPAPFHRTLEPEIGPR